MNRTVKEIRRRLAEGAFDLAYRLAGIDCDNRREHLKVIRKGDRTYLVHEMKTNVIAFPTEEGTV